MGVETEAAWAVDLRHLVEHLRRCEPELYRDLMAAAEPVIRALSDLLAIVGPFLSAPCICKSPAKPWGFEDTCPRHRR